MESQLSTICYDYPRFIRLADHLNNLTVRDWSILTPKEAIKDVPQDLKPLAHAFHGFLKEQHMFEDHTCPPRIEITGDTLVESLCHGKFVGLRKICEGLTLDELRRFKSLVPAYWYPLVIEFLAHHRISYGMLELSENENKDSW